MPAIAPIAGVDGEICGDVLEGAVHQRRERCGQIVARVVEDAIGHEERTGGGAGDVVAVGTGSAVDGHGGRDALDEEPVVAALAEQCRLGGDAIGVDQVEVVEVAATADHDGRRVGRVGRDVTENRDDGADRIEVAGATDQLAAADRDGVVAGGTRLQDGVGRQGEVVARRHGHVAGRGNDSTVRHDGAEERRAAGLEDGEVFAGKDRVVHFEADVAGGRLDEKHFESAAHLDQVHPGLRFGDQSTGRRGELFDLETIVRLLAGATTQDLDGVRVATDAAAYAIGNQVQVAALNVSLGIVDELQDRTGLSDEHDVGDTRQDLVEIQDAGRLGQVDAVRCQCDYCARRLVRRVDLEEVEGGADPPIERTEGHAVAGDPRRGAERGHLDGVEVVDRAARALGDECDIAARCHHVTNADVAAAFVQREVAGDRDEQFTGDTDVGARAEADEWIAGQGLDRNDRDVARRCLGDELVEGIRTSDFVGNVVVGEHSNVERRHGAGHRSEPTAVVRALDGCGTAVARRDLLDECLEQQIDIAVGGLDDPSVELGVGLEDAHPATEVDEDVLAGRDVETGLTGGLDQVDVEAGCRRRAHSTGDIDVDRSRPDGRRERLRRPVQDAARFGNERGGADRVVDGEPFGPAVDGVGGRGVENEVGLGQDRHRGFRYLGTDREDESAGTVGVHIDTRLRIRIDDFDPTDDQVCIEMVHDVDR